MVDVQNKGKLIPGIVRLEIRQLVNSNPFNTESVLRRLYDIYRIYIDKSVNIEEDLTCGKCRNKIISRMKYLLSGW